MSMWRAERIGIEKLISELRSAYPPRSQSSLSYALLQHFVRSLGSHLKGHFDRSSGVYTTIGEQSWCVEVDWAQRSANANHAHIIQRIERLESQADAADPFAMAGLIEQLEWLFDELDQHEEREAESLEWLLQIQCPGDAVTK